jgi:thymidylate kinase
MFVVLEGPEGVGKTTISQCCVERLGRFGIHATVVPEFSTSALGTYLHARLATDPFLREPGMQTAVTQVLAVAADTAHAVEYGVAPLLKVCDVVLKDRYRESLVACQYLALVKEYGWNSETAMCRLIEIATLMPFAPDITFHLQASAATRITRLRTRDGIQSGCDTAENIDYMARRAEAYQHLLENYPWTPAPVWIDAERPVDEVVSEICIRIKSIYERAS